MKIQQTQNLQIQSRRQNDIKTENVVNSTPSFTGAFDVFTSFLRFLDTNQAWGANFVDLSFMVIPRTTVDFTRGPDAGVETMRREASGTSNHALVGAYGLLAAMFLALGINKKYDIKANNIFVGGENLDTMGKAWHEQIHVKKAADPLDGYLEDIISKIKGFAPKKGDAVDWKFIDKDTQKEIIAAFKKELAKGKLSKEGRDYIKALVIRSIGSESKLKFDGTASDTAINTFIDNIYKVTNVFKADKVKAAFKDAASFDANQFIKGMKRFGTGTSLAGLIMAIGIGMSVQPFNRYLTKKKTGKDGFVGVEGREPDKTDKFKVMKGLIAGAFGAMVVSTIGKPSEFLKKIQFRGFTPTLNQLKVVYGLTIISRLLSARDKNELRESTIKDSLGFLHLLVLGNFVARLVATGFDKIVNDGDSLLNYSEKEHGKGLWNKITKAVIKTRDEILQTELKKAGVETVTKDGKALPFKELLKLAEKYAPKAKTKIKYLNLAQIAGYAYSGLVLGIGIPKLNIAVTKSFQKKAAEKAKAAEQSKPESQKAEAEKSETEKASAINSEFLTMSQKDIKNFGNLQSFTQRA